MRVAVVSYNMCGRASQACIVAKALGHEIHLVVYATAAMRQFNNRFDSIAIFASKEQMWQEIGNLKPDLIHVQDRPHRIAFDVLEQAWDCPVIYDVHDFASQMVAGRIAPGDEGEWIAVRNANGLVFVSEAHQRYAIQHFRKLPPNVVVPSFPCREFFPAVRRTPVGAAVWEGGLYAEPEESPRHYIDQREIIERFAAIGQSAVLHSAVPAEAATQAYLASGAILHEPQTYANLIGELSRYDFLWYGQTTDHEQIHQTYPNKMGEAIAAGIPVLAINAREAGRFVGEHGLGIHVRRPEDLIYVKDELRRMRDGLWQKRWGYTRERVTEPLWDLYERLTGKKGRPNVA